LVILAKQYRTLLTQFDPIGLNRYHIQEEDIEIVDRYLTIIQHGLIGETTWQEMLRFRGAYGTSILIHEIVEIRILETRGLQPLRQKTRTLRSLLAANVDAHVMAVYEEHQYLQDVLSRLYGQIFEVATLVKANRSDEIDLQFFLESDVGVFLLEEDRISDARLVLARLKGELNG
jgi:hypothetical protein